MDITNGITETDAENRWKVGFTNAAANECHAEINLTQKKFANRLGINQHHVSEMKNNKRKIGIEMAKRIAMEFKVPYKAFLC
ncbi:MAG: helix-turn-helix domain-containing protein [Deltaproteobacteria bacterium]|jgi:plasmid maintenance system antidote protein VapI|nr:helix-turn-helix domain-containing protein [Deltaproteobacteria bacterium]